jgi:glycosyltransferase involved in cell wall biosynthesis
VSDTVKDGETGFLSEENLPSFTAKLTRLCIDKSLRKRMGDSARQTSTLYAIERTTHVLLQHYENLVYTSRPRRENWAVRLRGFFENYLQ